MDWDEAEEAIREYIESQWASESYSSIPLVFENETVPDNGQYIIINIEGIESEKTIYGSSGFRASQDFGIVFFHSFGPVGVGKISVLDPCVLMGLILELRVIESRIYLSGANPPSPVEIDDPLVPGPQPEGQFYRCSGSVPFVLIGTI